LVQQAHPILVTLAVRSSFLLLIGDLRLVGKAAEITGVAQANRHVQLLAATRLLKRGLVRLLRRGLCRLIGRNRGLHRALVRPVRLLDLREVALQLLPRDHPARHLRVGPRLLRIRWRLCGRPWRLYGHPRNTRRRSGATATAATAAVLLGHVGLLLAQLRLLLCLIAVTECAQVVELTPFLGTIHATLHASNLRRVKRHFTLTCFLKAQSY